MDSTNNFYYYISSSIIRYNAVEKEFST